MEVVIKKAPSDMNAMFVNCMGFRVKGLAILMEFLSHIQIIYLILNWIMLIAEVN